MQTFKNRDVHEGMFCSIRAHFDATQARLPYHRVHDIPEERFHHVELGMVRPEQPYIKSVRPRDLGEDGGNAFGNFS